MIEWLSEGNTSYKEGEEAATLLERKQAFNRALFFYHQVEQEYPKTQQSSALNLAIGNTYFQLGKYPWSILYYSRSLKQDPTQDSSQHYLKLAQEKLGIVQKPRSSIFSQFLSFNYLLSLPDRLFLLYGCLLGCLIFGSLAIWSSLSLLYKLTLSFIILCLGLTFNILLSWYTLPIEGILVATTGLYRDAQFSQTQIRALPLQEGLNVLIFEVQGEGKWLKIQDPEGQIGYVPAFAVRII